MITPSSTFAQSAGSICGCSSPSSALLPTLSPRPRSSPLTGGTPRACPRRWQVKFVTWNFLTGLDFALKVRSSTRLNTIVDKVRMRAGARARPALSRAPGSGACPQRRRAPTET